MYLTVTCIYKKAFISHFLRPFHCEKMVGRWLLSKVQLSSAEKQIQISGP